MSVEIDVLGKIKVEKMLNRNYHTKLPKLVGYLANFMKNKTKENLKQAVYDRIVGWKRTGQLRQSVQTTDIGIVSKKVVVTKEYGKFIEYGTKPHVIKPKKGKFLVFQIARMARGGKAKTTGKAKSGLIFARSVRHPGTKPRPFFAPAVRSTRVELNKTINKFL